jgi:hypothetical protein
MKEDKGEGMEGHTTRQRVRERKESEKRSLLQVTFFFKSETGNEHKTFCR